MVKAAAMVDGAATMAVAISFMKRTGTLRGTVLTWETMDRSKMVQRRRVIRELSSMQSQLSFRVKDCWV